MNRAFHSRLLSLEDKYSRFLRICTKKDALCGKAFHCQILKSLTAPTIYLSNCMIKMYVVFDQMRNASQVVVEMPYKDSVSWYTLICGFTQRGDHISASLHFCSIVQSDRPVPDGITFSAMLKSCACFGRCIEGLIVHCSLNKRGWEGDSYIGCSLVDFYVKLQQFGEATKVFDLSAKDTVLVNNMISLHVLEGNFTEAVAKFKLVMLNSWIPARATFVNLLSVFDSCARVKLVGVVIHALVVKFGLEDDGPVHNGLVSMYASSRNFDTALNLLQHSGPQNSMSWTSILSSYVDSGYFLEAATSFCHLHSANVEKDAVLLSTVLNACGGLECFPLGTQIHSLIVRLGHNSDVYVCDSLILMYGSSLILHCAQKVFFEMNGFHDVYTWTMLLSAYVQNGFTTEAVEAFYQMQYEGIKPDSVACTSVLGGFSDLVDVGVHNGEKIHGYLIKSGCECETIVKTSLLSLYSDCGHLDSAFQLFHEMVVHDVVSWTALISGCADCGHSDAALLLLVKMIRQGVKPNQLTLATSICVCAKLTAILTGKSLHACVEKLGFGGNKFIESSLIDMYSKCGFVTDAETYFQKTKKDDVVLWNSLISGHAYHGNGAEVIKLFGEMHSSQCIKPDHVTFLAVLSSCNHCGLVENVMEFFSTMFDRYKIEAGEEHYACVIGAFGHAGMFVDALNLFEKLPTKTSVIIWRSLLSCCHLHGQYHLALAVTGKIIKTCLGDTATYVLLSGIYASNGRWKQAAKVREIMDRKCIKKGLAQSWVEGP